MQSEVISKVEDAVSRLKNKFLEAPFSFYSETDMHCYLYNVLYQDSFLREPVNVGLKNGKTVQTIRLHREYPTLGKFYKRGRLLVPKENKYIIVDGKKMQPSRGAYDLAIIEPDAETDFKHQKTSIAIELALNEFHPTLWHLQNDYTKITYPVDRVERGYILFFVRKIGLSEEIIGKRLPQIRSNLRKMFQDKLQPKVRILYLESPIAKRDSEIHLPSEWAI